VLVPFIYIGRRRDALRVTQGNGADLSANGRSAWLYEISMTKVLAALMLALLGTILMLNIYLLLKYLVVADSLRKIVNRSSGDGRRI
jgi:hypothetical protein